MYLLDTTTFELHEFSSNDIPEYAILSHRWSGGEVSVRDLQKGKGPQWPDLQRSRAAASRRPRMAGNIHGSTPAVLTNPAAPSFRRQSIPCTDGTKMRKFAMCTYWTCQKVTRILAQQILSEEE
jgi:hypothetical protein